MNTNTNPNTLRMAAAAGVLALALAACGDSGTTTTVPPDDTVTTTTQTTDPTGTTGGATTTRSTATTSTTADNGGTTATSAPGDTTAPPTTATQATAAPSNDDALAQALAVREAPLVIELGDGTTITFSEWFFATFNREATVTVERDGNVLAEGTVVDPAVMEDRGADGFAFFGPDGGLVATLTQSELLDAANQALIDAGLAP